MDMDAYCGRFRFAWDMNADLAFSISDLWLLAQALYLLPATALTSALHSIDATATFFEVSCSTGQGLGGFALSTVAWFTALVLLQEVLVKA